MTRICNPSTDSETSLKLMRYWKFSQKTKLKQKFFADSEKEVENFFKTRTIVISRKKFTYLRVPELHAFFTQRLQTFCKTGVVLVLRGFRKIGSKDGLMKFLGFRHGHYMPGNPFDTAV